MWPALLKGGAKILGPAVASMGAEKLKDKFTGGDENEGLDKGAQLASLRQVDYKQSSLGDLAQNRLGMQNFKNNGSPAEGLVAGGAGKDLSFAEKGMGLASGVLSGEKSGTVGMGIGGTVGLNRFQDAREEGKSFREAGAEALKGGLSSGIGGYFLSSAHSDMEKDGKDVIGSLKAGAGTFLSAMGHGDSMSDAFKKSIYAGGTHFAADNISEHVVDKMDFLGDDGKQMATDMLEDSATGSEFGAAYGGKDGAIKGGLAGGAAGIGEKVMESKLDDIEAAEPSGAAAIRQQVEQNMQADAEPGMMAQNKFQDQAADVEAQQAQAAEASQDAQYA